MDTKGDKESGRNWESGTDIGIYILYIYLCFSIVYSIYIYTYILVILCIKQKTNKIILCSSGPPLTVPW